MTSSLPRLNRELLAGLRNPDAGVVEIPSEKLLDLPEIAVQFGTGALLRGFIEDFLHRANEQGLFGGRVVAIGSTGSTRDRALNEQDGLYTLVVEGIERGERIEQKRIISSLSRALSAVDEWDAVLALARSPELGFVFSNTTEVGIVADEQSLFDDAPPKSFPAKLTRFLYERAVAHDFSASSGLVVIPCELIESNGAKLRDMVLEIANRWKVDARFAEWIDAAVPFCNTLVDRIVPGFPRAEEAEALSVQLGYSDEMMTCCEPYRLFAIEAPAAVHAQLGWTAADEGIIVASDIAPYRQRKVHLLNAPHTLLACVALPMGHETVRDAITDAALHKFLRGAMLDEIAPMLDVEGADTFADAVLDRFRNPFIRHALADITLQGTMKMKVRVVPIVDRYIAQRGEVPQALAFGFAAFLAFMDGTFQSRRVAAGLAVPADNHAERLRAAWCAAGSDVSALVRAVASDVTLWDADLTGLPGWCDAVAEQLGRIRSVGIAAALDQHLSSPVS